MDFKRLFTYLSILVTCQFTYAESVTLTTNEIVTFIQNSKNLDQVSQLIGEKLKTELDEQQLILRGGTVFQQVQNPNESGEADCNKWSVTNSWTTTTLDRDTTFTFTSTNLNKPLELNAKGKANVRLSADIKVTPGTRVSYVGGFPPKIKHKCAHIYPSYRVSLVGTAQVSVDLNALLETNASMRNIGNDKIAIRISPEVKIWGKVDKVRDLKILVTEGSVAGIPVTIPGISQISERLLPQVNFSHDLLILWLAKREVNKRYVDQKEEMRRTIATRMAEALLSPSEYAGWGYGQPVVKEYELPAISVEIFNGLVRLISSTDLPFPIAKETLEAFNQNKELYYALIIGDVELVRSALSTSLACEAGSRLMVDMNVIPTSTYFKHTSLPEYCTSVIGENGKNSIGNADIWDDEYTSTPWELSPGLRIDLGVKSIRDNYQPYMKKEKYKIVPSKIIGERTVSQTCEGYDDDNGSYEYDCSYLEKVHAGNGYCKLEMRIYKQNPTASNLKPLMAIHGGSYKYRGFGFNGLEAQISHFTDRGFVVFAPFYRLIGDSDGNVECHSATGQELIDDVTDALKWVEQNSSQYGASGKVTLFGQSAGAHLAAYLNTYQSNSVDRSWLMYPPTDVRDYVDNLSPGDTSLGVAALSGFLEETMLELNVANLEGLKGVTHPFLTKNSLPTVIAGSNISYPAMFMMHGVADDLVPSSQSVRLCNALARSSNLNSGAAVNSGVDPANGEPRRIFNCGSESSQLHLFSEAKHILDLKCVEENLGERLCTAGSYRSSNLVKNSFDSGLNWLTFVAPPPKVVDTYQMTSPGSFSFNDSDGEYRLYWGDRSGPFANYGGGSGTLYEQYTDTNGNVSNKTYPISARQTELLFSGANRKLKGNYLYTFNYCGQWGDRSGGCSPSNGWVNITIIVE